MVKLKDLLKEGSPGYENRQFGDPLPTLKDIMKEKKMKDLELGKVYTDSDMPPFKVTEEVVDEATSSKSFFSGFKQLPLYKEMNPNQRQAVSIALIMGGDMTGAVREIEKIKKGLSKNKKVRNALRLANESVEESVNEEETINEAPEQQMASQLNKISDTILKITNKFKGKADVDGMTRSWMMGLRAKLKKVGIKVWLS